MDNKVAILVDYDMFRRSPTVQRWCQQRENKATLVMLVSEPKEHDYDPDSAEHKGGAEFPITIRNTGGQPDLVFKTSALCVLQDMSDLLPSISLDPSYAVQSMMRDGGVIVTLYEKDLHYDE